MRIRQVPFEDDDAQRLVALVQDEYVARYGGPDETPLAPGTFSPPDGAFFVGYDGDRPVAIGGWRLRPDVRVLGGGLAAEVKRMFVVAHARRRGLARVLLTHLEQTARTRGADVVVLETGLAQPEAIALYESSGYTAVPGFGYYRDSPTARCFGKLLVGPGHQPRSRSE